MNRHGSEPSGSDRADPTNLLPLDPRETPYIGPFRLKALWTVWSVEVRVFSGASGKAQHCGAFPCLRQNRAAPHLSGILV